MKIIIIADKQKLEQCGKDMNYDSAEKMLDDYLKEWTQKAYNDLDVALLRHRALAGTLSTISNVAAKAFGIAPMKPPFMINTAFEIDGDKMKISFEVYSYERMLIDAVGGPDRFKQKMEEAEKKLTRMERTKLKMIGGLEKLTDSAINSKRFRDITVKQFKDSFAGAYIEDK